MATTTRQKRTIPGYREPWTGGAKAYAEADTPEALIEGTKRKRNRMMVHLSHDGFGDMPCVKCGIPVGEPYRVNDDEEAVHEDKWATGQYDPKNKRLVAAHYYCSWSMLMDAVVRLGRTIG